ncbi:hypothetical protein [Sphingobium sp.]|jgi:hypothetical protein|uniref:hypothetical protein n=1 Tax=Sphingobium sp. TaxID=1912891 RepID=UPI003BB68B37
MAKRPLKVFCTTAGFQDAYVATTSQKAALEAWGARSNLFANGVAEIVTDPKLAEAALAEPGKVIRAPRGTTAQHLAAAARSEKPSTRRRPKEGRVKANGGSRMRAQPKPKPSRAKLNKVVAALEDQRRAFEAELSEIGRRISELRRQRDDCRAKRDAELTKLEQ